MCEDPWWGCSPIHIQRDNQASFCNASDHTCDQLRWNPPAYPHLVTCLGQRPAEVRSGHRPLEHDSLTRLALQTKTALPLREHQFHGYRFYIYFHIVQTGKKQANNEWTPYSSRRQVLTVVWFLWFNSDSYGLLSWTPWSRHSSGQNGELSSHWKTCCLGEGPWDLVRHSMWSSISAAWVTYCPLFPRDLSVELHWNFVGGWKISELLLHLPLLQVGVINTVQGAV